MQGLLEQSLATLSAAVWEVPADVLPAPIGTPWSARRSIAHLVAYEEALAAPALEELLAGGDGMSLIEVASGPEAWPSREAELERLPIQALLARLGAARQRQADAVRAFSDEAFHEATCRFWGLRDGTRQTPAWVAMKTVQHTWEHGTPVLQAMLFAQR